MVRIVFTRVRFARVDDEELKMLPLIFPMELRQWGNLPHEGRSSDAAEFEQDMLLAGKRRQRNHIAVDIGQAEVRRPGPYRRDRPKVRRVGLALPKTLVVVTTHGLAPLVIGSRVKNIRLVLSSLIENKEGEGKPYVEKLTAFTEVLFSRYDSKVDSRPALQKV